MRPLVVAADPRGFQAGNGAYIRPDLALADCPGEGDPWPDLFVAPGTDLAGRDPQEVEWLRRCHAAGTTIAASCSGALLLAESGLLDCCAATIHWAYCTAMQRSDPRVEVQGSRVLVAAGEGQRINTAGGGTSWQDMALFLVALHFGQEEAMHLARIYLMDWHPHGQLPFAALAGSRQDSDRQVALAQDWLAENYQTPHAVADMVAASGLPDRSYKHRFRQATGMTPIDYVHTLRLEEAKQALETGTDPVEAVAAEVGYEDASFVRRRFRRKVGLSPSEYRRRFATIRRALGEAEAGRTAA
ncbi:GlxA family transcriptional regulator [Marinibaculum pumilum]|uniref:GlxA family transcriptional regulator n=1 Tax=Marinibaculum pumilum TaxID=1766165 RepID=A0ABV7L0H3_9PROT